jgi:hypothetical protein
MTAARNFDKTAEGVFAITGTPDNPDYVALPNAHGNKGDRYGGNVSIPDGTFALVHTHGPDARHGIVIVSPDDIRESDSKGMNTFVVSLFGAGFYAPNSGRPISVGSNTSWKSGTDGIRCDDLKP